MFARPTGSDAQGLAAGCIAHLVEAAKAVLRDGGNTSDREPHAACASISSRISAAIAKCNGPQAEPPRRTAEGRVEVLEHERGPFEPGSSRARNESHE